MKPIKKSLISLQEVVIVWLETTKKGSTLLLGTQVVKSNNNYCYYNNIIIPVCWNFFTDECVFIFKVDLFLDKLKNVTKEDDQQMELTKMTKRYRGNKLKLVERKNNTVL